MKNEKTILLIVLAVVIFSAGFLTKYFIGKATDNKRIADHQSTIEAVANVLEKHGISIEGVGESYIESDRIIESLESGLSELDRRNSEAEARAENAVESLRLAGAGLESAYGLAGKIGSGIESVIAKIEQFGEDE